MRIRNHSSVRVNLTNTSGLSSEQCFWSDLTELSFDSFISHVHASATNDTKNDKSNENIFVDFRDPIESETSVVVNFDENDFVGQLATLPGRLLS